MRCFFGGTGLIDSILVMLHIPLKVIVVAYLNRTAPRPSSCIKRCTELLSIPFIPKIRAIPGYLR